MKRTLLIAAIVLGIGGPGVLLGAAALGVLSLPTWAAVALPIILFGSVRGTAVLLGWKAFRWALPRFKDWHRARGEASAASTSTAPSYEDS